MTCMMSVSNCQLVIACTCSSFPQPVNTLLIEWLDHTMRRIHSEVDSNEFIQPRDVLFTSRPKHIDSLLSCLRSFHHQKVVSVLRGPVRPPSYRHESLFVMSGLLPLLAQ